MSRVIATVIGWRDTSRFGPAKSASRIGRVLEGAGGLYIGMNDQGANHPGACIGGHVTVEGCVDMVRASAGHPSVRRWDWDGVVTLA